MAESAFVIFTLLYFLVATKLDEWQTISRLGFHICTPHMYLKKPHLYDYTCWALFWIAALSCVWFTLVPWWPGPGILLAVWTVCGIRGRVAAFKTYRRLHAEMLESEHDETMRNNIAEQLRKTNSELLHDRRLVAL